MKKKLREIKKNYYTRYKIKKLTEILKYRFVVTAIRDGAFYDVYLNNKMKDELLKYNLRTFDNYVYDPTLISEERIKEIMNANPKVEHDESCIVM